MIVDQWYRHNRVYLLGEVHFGVQGQSPGGGQGAKLNVFFHFQKGIVALKRGRRPS
jgi:hypothetical protein